MLASSLVTMLVPRSRRWLLALVPLLLTSLPARADTDWVLLLDRSQSMTQNDPHNYRFDAQNIMVDLLAQGAGETNRLTIVRFAATSEVVLNREIISVDSLDRIRKTISNDPPEGDTDIGAALALVRKTVPLQGRVSDVHVILLTDGVQAGKILNLRSRLEDEKRAFVDMGLPVNCIILNDYSISEAERAQRRSAGTLYDDKVLREGEDLLRDLARRTRGRLAQVTPESGIEDIVLQEIAPHMSFYREDIAGQIRTLPTDRQLFILFDRKTTDAKLRIGAEEALIDLRKQEIRGGNYDLVVSPYSNLTVVTVRPAKNVRWPEWIDVLPGPSQNPIRGEVFIISNVRLSIVQGLGATGTKEEGEVKTKIRENEVYPVLFRITLPEDVVPERQRYIQETIKTSVVRIQAVGDDGKVLEQRELPGGDVFAGTGNRLFFVPTAPNGGENRIKESFGLTVKATLQFSTGGSQRALAKAPDRNFVVTPSPFEWVVRRNWKGEPESAALPATRRDLDVELGQEFRLEVIYEAAAALEGLEIRADLSRPNESAARRLVLREVGGSPRTFVTDWIFPPTTGEFKAKVSVKTDVVQEVDYRISVLRDDFRAADATYSDQGADSAGAVDLGTFVAGERIKVSRARTIDRIAPEATAKYWSAESAVALKAQLLAKEPSKGAWETVKPLPLTFAAPVLGAARISVVYEGEFTDLGMGEYLLTWPEKRPPVGDLSTDSRTDVLKILAPAFAASLLGDDGKALAVEGGKAVHQAGKGLVLKLVPSPTFPSGFNGEIVATLTWARKDVGAPQVVKAAKGADGAYTAAFTTTDFHTGPAKLRLVMTWKAAGRDHVIEQDFEVNSLPKALGVTMEPVSEDILIGERKGQIRFKVRPMGGEEAQVQRDLVSLWLSQPVNVTIGDSEQIYRVNLAAEGETLLGSLEMPNLPPGTYKLVVSSPVAKLGQDVAACFFNVKPSPVVPRIVKSSSGTDQVVLLEPGLTSAKCEGDGALWATVDPGELKGEKPLKVVSAELSVSGKPVELKWTPMDNGGLRSGPVALEDLDRETRFGVTATDDAGRTYDWDMGAVSVAPMPLGFEVVWAKVPPAELGRGDFCRVAGAVRIRGGLRAQRKEAREALEKMGDKLFVVLPPSALEKFEILPVLVGSAAGASEAIFGERVSFEARISIGTADREIRDQVLVEVRGQDGSVLDSRRIALGVSPLQLSVGRPSAEAEGGVLPSEGMPIFARERIRFAIDDKSGIAQKRYRIQVLAPEGESSPPLATADGRVLEWTPKKEGAFRVVAEAEAGADLGWRTVEKLEIAPPLKLEWPKEVAEGSVKLDTGQYLPLFVRIRGPAFLDWDGVQRLFTLRPEVLGQGGQVLAVEFSPWEADKSGPSDAVAVKAFSTKPISASASRVRVLLEPKGGKPDSTPLDVLELDLVRGGGSLVIVDNFEAGPAGYRIRDLLPDYKIAKNSRVRFGYRTGSSLSDTTSLKNNIAATVTPVGGGADKVLDVESVAPELVIFTPYEAKNFGRFKVHLEIKGERTQLRQEPEFEVVKGVSDWMFLGFLVLLGLAAVGAAFFVGWRGLGYQKDRQVIQARIRTRAEKALADLANEPSERLLGEVRLNVGGKSLGPLDLDGTPSLNECAAWVDQHFSMETELFGDPQKNEKRKTVIEGCISAARTELLAETEKRLPVRGADVCLQQSGAGGGKLEAKVIHERIGTEHEGMKTLVSLRLAEGGKIRISTPSGRTVAVGRGEDFPYNGWIGKNGSQIRASVKVPGFADYLTVTIDLK